MEERHIHFSQRLFFWKVHKHFAYDLPLLKQQFVPRCVAAAAAEEPAATEAPAIIQDETSEPTSESEEDSDVDDEQDETATDAAVADEATSHVELSTGKPLT